MDTFNYPDFYGSFISETRMASELLRIDVNVKASREPLPLPIPSSLFKNGVSNFCEIKQYSKCIFVSPEKMRTCISDYYYS